MSRRIVVTTLAGVVGVVLLAACGGVVRLVRTDARDESDCATRVAAEEAKVHTDRRWTEREVPGIGAYRDVHWQVDLPSHACSRPPGPTDHSYQGVATLAPADARALAAAYTWTPVTGDPVAVLPGLVPYVPEGVRWRRSTGYETAGAPTVRFDPDRRLLLFVVRQW